MKTPTICILLVSQILCTEYRTLSLWLGSLGKVFLVQLDKKKHRLMEVHRSCRAGGMTLLRWPRLLSKHTLHHQRFKQCNSLLIAHAAYVSCFEYCVSSASFSVFSLLTTNSMNWATSIFHMGLLGVIDKMLRVCTKNSSHFNRSHITPYLQALTGNSMSTVCWQQTCILQEGQGLPAHLTSRKKFWTSLLLNLPPALTELCEQLGQSVACVTSGTRATASPFSYAKSASFECQWLSIPRRFLPVVPSALSWRPLICQQHNVH